MDKKTGKSDRRGKNFYISVAVTEAAAKIAAEYYNGRSLSWLTEKLLLKEIHRRQKLKEAA